MRGIVTSFLVLTLLLSSGAIPTVAPLQGGIIAADSTVPVPALPEPMALPSGTPDEQAAILARYVLAGGETALPALLAGLQASGISILHVDGRVAVPAVQGAGVSRVALFDWEVFALIGLESHGLSTTLPDLGATIAATDPILADAPVGDFLVDGIRRSATGDDPVLRFWARFVIAFGVYGSSSYDLMTDFDATASLLDAVQISLLLNRVVADLLVEVPEITQVGTGERLAFAQQAGSQAPCQLTDVEGRILSGTGIAGNLGFEAFKTFMEKAGAIGGDAAANLALSLGIANSVSAFLQLIWAWIGFVPEIQVEPPGPPLVRTKTRTPGEQRVVRLRVVYDSGDLQFLNCLRPVLQLAGLDLNQAISENGPVKGAEVAWTIPKGNISDVNNPGSRQLDQLIEYHSGNVLHTVTDEDGVARVTVEGVAQRKPLPESTVPVPKEAQVRATVSLKPEANLSDEAMSVLSNMLCGGGGAVVACAIPEMLLRSHLLFNASLTFQVIDWALPGGFHVTHHTRVISSEKGVGIDVTWESTLKPGKDADDLSEMTGTGTYFGTVMEFPANAPLCQESDGAAVAIGGTIAATGTRDSGYVIYNLEGTRTLGKLEGNVFGVPPDIAALGVVPVDLEIGSNAIEKTTVIATDDKCYGTIIQVDSISITTIPVDPTS